MAAAPLGKRTTSDPQPQRDGIYRLILALMLADVVVGLGLVLFGLFALESRSVAAAGAGLALIGLLLFLFFRWLGARVGGPMRR